MPRVVLKPRRARPFFAGHPWVYKNSIARIESTPTPGSEVSVVSAEGVPIGRGLWNPDSMLGVRLYRWVDAPLDTGFWRGRIESALRLRRALPDRMGPGQACRLVFSEGDGLSGLIVDRYDRALLVQFSSRALWERRAELVAPLQELLDPQELIVRFDPASAALEGFDPPEEERLGAATENLWQIVEHGLRFEVDPHSHQKTGFYLDQRENRLAVARWASGRRALDLYCYTGAFALNLRRHGLAASVLAVDSSSMAIERARRHAAWNEIDNVEFREGDVVSVLAGLKRGGERFGLVVCDPPKFARTRRDVDAALRAYLHLNRAAIDVLEPDGILATCSCSGHVDRWTFQNVLAQAAEHARRPIQMIEAWGQAPDHPIALACPETEYLKCLICRVE